MPTISSELDSLAGDVTVILAATKPPRNYVDAAAALYSRFGLRVTPDNLRVWHVRRVAVDISSRTPADVRCDIDDYSEAIRLWREEARSWATISRLLAEGFDFKVTGQALRGWWWRRKTRAEKAAAGSSAVARGVASMSVAPVASSSHAATSAPEPDAPSAASAPAPADQRGVAGRQGSRALPGESDVQRRIREKHERDAQGASIQDQLLDRLAASGSAAGVTTP